MVIGVVKNTNEEFLPTKGVGLRKLIHKRFQTISINEFRELLSYALVVIRNFIVAS